MKDSYSKALLSKWEVLKETLYSSCRIYDVYKRRCKNTVLRKESDFFVIKSPDWCQIIALTEEEELILVKQFRFGSLEYSLEVPGGLIEEGETPLNTAVRELQEETGYKGTNETVIGMCEPNPAIMNNRSYFVLINNCKQVSAPNWDEHEQIAVIKVPFKKAYHFVMEGKILHSLSQTAILMLKECKNL